MARRDSILALIRQAADEFGIPFSILAAQAYTESGLNPTAIGDNGNSIGVMQIQPRWWRSWAEKRGWDINTPEGNVMTGAAILSSAFRAEGGSWVKALRRYNGGPAWEQKSQTATYARKVIQNANRFVDGVSLPKGFSKGEKFGETGPRWRHTHTGQDFPAPLGTPTPAFVAGRVSRVLRSDKGYGWQVWVTGEDGLEHLYAHLSRIDVGAGEDVSQGQVIGAVGQTGNTTGPHLHYGIRKGKKWLDPMTVLRGVKVSDTGIGEAAPPLEEAVQSLAGLMASRLGLEDPSPIVEHLTNLANQAMTAAGQGVAPEQPQPSEVPNEATTPPAEPVEGEAPAPAATVQPGTQPAPPVDQPYAELPQPEIEDTGADRLKEVFQHLHLLTGGQR